MKVYIIDYSKSAETTTQYREHKKFPLELVGRDAQGHERWRTEVTKVTPGSVDDAVFALPDAYRKVELHLGGAPTHS